MFHRRLPAVLQAGCLILAISSLFLSFSYLITRPPWRFSKVQTVVHGWAYESPYNTTDFAIIPTREGDPRRLREAPARIEAILNSSSTAFQKLECPEATSDRYAYLEGNRTPTDRSPDLTKRNNPPALPKYFFALDLHDNVHVIPQLLGSIVETMRFLGPENCALSIVEGRSIDGTYEVLKLLRPHIEQLGATYFFTINDSHPTGKNSDRIKILAELRNQALKPLVDNPGHFASNTTVIFSNDIALCMEDILELIHQRIYQKADMTCAMDWIYPGPNPTFYDVWIARGIGGDTFFDIPRNGSWGNAWNLFWNDVDSRDRLQTGKPFQVFSCWNGITAFTAEPILKDQIRFRRSFENECYQGEPQIFCKEMWYHGYGRIAVIPSINVGYSNMEANAIREVKGYVSRWVGSEYPNDESLLIQWKPDPPRTVKCMPNYGSQNWFPWDEHLAENGVFA